MTKILLVEDDAAQARVLSRAISVRRPDYEVLLAQNGVEAKALLREEDVDLVLTDLQMPEMNGFELLAWLLEQRPSVAVFTMTAYGNEQTASQLADYGPVACFTKPIDIESVIARMTTSLSEGLRGHVRNLSLPPFLQLLELERATCTLTVQGANQRGRLFIQDGELFDARAGKLSGEAAALSVLAWPSPRITISGAGPASTRSIDKPMSFVIMEALRLQDEHAHQKFMARKSFPPFVLEDASRGLTVPGNAVGVAVVDLRSGVILAHGQKAGVPLSELSAMALTILRQEVETVARCDESEQLEELVLSSPSSCELLRRLPGSSSAFVLMVFKPEETTLAAARLDLERLLVDPAWLSSITT
jgi:CheY-like chemotaxis protein